MTAVVVDTNVGVVANGGAEQADPECVQQCVDRLADVIERSLLVLDDGRRILREYLANLLPDGQAGVGDRFLKWVVVNQANPERCEIVTITPRFSDGDDFEEFPDDSDLATFDRSDRKFVAVALASRLNPPILNASDTDWWNFRETLQRHGVRIEFLCPKLMGND